MKTITLKEAYAKATPTPLQIGYHLKYCFHEGNKGSIVRVTPADHPENQSGEDTEETVAEVWPGPTDMFDTVLLAHAYNSLPEVMKQLKIAERFMSGFEDDRESNPSVRHKLVKIRKAIAKANTVTLP